jgi:hypothetical protein
VGELESVIFTVKVVVPTSPAVAVPVMAPELGSRVKPVGSVPEARLQVTGNVPPLSSYFRVWLYASPTIGFNRLVVVIVNCTIVRLSVALAVCCGELESAAWNVMLNAPAADGVPVISPVVEFRFRPAGNVVPPITLQEIGASPPLL